MAALPASQPPGADAHGSALAEPPQPGLTAGARAALARELRLILRRPGDAVGAALFFIMACSLFPLALGPDPAQLTRLAGGVVWMAALLASLLPLPRLFGDDLADGTLEQWRLSPHPMALLVLGKVGAQAGTQVGLLLLAAPVVGVQYGLSGPAIATLCATLALGLPVLALLGGLAAALALGLRGGSLLLALLVLPLAAPVLVFGAAAVEAAQAAGTVAAAIAPLSLLGAALLAALGLAPMATAAALRIALET
jgi:heme exporter protein B